MKNSKLPIGDVLVVGASGKLGGEIVRQLRAASWPVRAMTREPSRANHLEALGARIVVGDLLDRTSLERACVGAETVIASAHAALSRGANRPQTVDGQGHRDLIDVASEAKVKHFVYVSAISVAANHPIDFFRIKYETEKYLEASDLSHSIVRGAAFIETQNEVAGKALLKSGKAVLFGKGNQRNNYVSVVDVAKFVVLALQDDRLANRVIEIGGPENLTQNQLIDVYERVTGRQAKRIHLSIPVLKILRGLIGPFHPVARRMLTMGVLLGSEEHPFDMQDVLREFPMELTRCEDAIQTWWDSRRSA